MNFTGERFIPECRGDIAIAHYHRYLIASQFAIGKNVLDIACGEGYGSELLSHVAKNVIGVDISIEAIEHACSKYNVDNLTFLHGTASNIPIPDASVDLVVSFETIEHLYEQKEMIKEFKRVLSKGGLLILSSPDKAVYKRREKYDNPFHVKELYKEELCDLILSQFKNIKICGQQFIYGSIIVGQDISALSSVRIEDDRFVNFDLLKNSLYLICYASDESIPIVQDSVLSSEISESSEVIALSLQLEKIQKSWIWRLAIFYENIRKNFIKIINALCK